jgi:hypothetical protein
MFWEGRYILQLEAKIKAMENEIRRVTERSYAEREKFQAREIQLIDRLLAKNGVPEVNIGIKDPQDINNMAIFEDIEPILREPEDIMDERKGEHLDAFAS